MIDYQATPDFYNDYLSHHGRLGQRWYHKNGPPYPLDRETVSEVYGGKAGSEGKIKDKINEHKSWKEDVLKKESEAIDQIFYNHKKMRPWAEVEKDALNDIEPFIEATHPNPKKIKEVSGIKIKNKENTIIEDMDAINPNYEKGPGYDTNCVFCSMTYDARARGYDVTAKPRLHEEIEDDVLTLKNFYDIPKDYFNVNGNGKSHNFAHVSNDRDRWNKDGSLKSKPTSEERQTLIKGLEAGFARIPNNSRGMLTVDFWFAGDGEGHAVAWEKRNNKVLILDCQTSEVYTVESYDLIRNGYISRAEIYRFDNLKVKPEKLKEFCS